jgi:hypothetical protein
MIFIFSYLNSKYYILKFLYRYYYYFNYKFLDYNKIIHYSFLNVIVIKYSRNYFINYFIVFIIINYFIYLHQIFID